MRVCTERYAKSSGKAEICDFEVAMYIDQQILWLQVAMQDSAGVEIIDALDELCKRDKCISRLDGRGLYIQRIKFAPGR